MVNKKERNEVAVKILQKQVDEFEYKIRQNAKSINKISTENSFLKKQRSELHSVIQRLKDESK